MSVHADFVYVYAKGDSDVIQYALISAAMFEAFLVQQCNFVNLSMLRC